MCLLALPGYSMRIKATAMVGLRPQQKINKKKIKKWFNGQQKIDFHPSMSELEPPLKLILSTCQEILVNRSLQNFMAVVLQLGNVLNSVNDVYWIITQYYQFTKIHFIL